MEEQGQSSGIVRFVKVAAVILLIILVGLMIVRAVQNREENQRAEQAVRTSTGSSESDDASSRGGSDGSAADEESSVPRGVAEGDSVAPGSIPEVGMDSGGVVASAFLGLAVYIGTLYWQSRRSGQSL